MRVESGERSIVLASRSPRRLELARRAGWQVRVVPPPEAAERDAAMRLPKETPEAYVRRLAGAKASAVGAMVHRGTILACDTVGELDGVLLGKPADRDEAHRMLVALAGRSHRVITGMCVWRRPELEPVFGHAESLLEMDPYPVGFLDWYLESRLWEGKAGACGYQDERLPLRLVSGSASNVVGLPLELLDQLLADMQRRGQRS
jgi:septum formation protein